MENQSFKCGGNNCLVQCNTRHKRTEYLAPILDVMLLFSIFFNPSTFINDKHRVSELPLSHSFQLFRGFIFNTSSTPFPVQTFDWPGRGVQTDLWSWSLPKCCQPPACSSPWGNRNARLLQHVCSHEHNLVQRNVLWRNTTGPIPKSCTTESHWDLDTPDDRWLPVLSVTCLVIVSVRSVVLTVSRQSVLRMTGEPAGCRARSLEPIVRPASIGRVCDSANKQQAKGTDPFKTKPTN